MQLARASADARNARRHRAWTGLAAPSPAASGGSMPSRQRWAGLLAWLGPALAMLAVVGPARADSGLALGSTVFREAGGPLKMTVIVPSAEASVDVVDALGVNAHWTADIVSGASVAVVDATAEDIDAISSATLKDTRHVFGGGLELRGDLTSISAGYSYGFENDYRSHAFDLSARTELYDRNTVLELSYARAFDDVCDSPDAPEAVQKQRLDSSQGCFTDDDEREQRDLNLQTFQAAWTQAWTPHLAMQLKASAQLLNGYQANPYRAVRIGRTAAQEHHPNNRARYAAGLGLRLWVVPLNGSVQVHGRAYRDTWDIRSLSLQAAYEQVILADFRIRVRGRYYVQSGANFYSDDYELRPRGQYFTGDRELSPMRSLLAGIDLTWSAPGGDDGTGLGFLSGLDVS